jgi:hypothetical protein
MREGRLFSAAGEVVKTDAERLAAADVTTSFTPIVDQTVSGLNFRTHRDRLEILDDFLKVVSAVYEPKSYFDRMLRLTSLLKRSTRHRPGWFELKREMLALVRLTRVMHSDKATRQLFWRNIWAALWKGRAVFAQMAQLIAVYVHLRQQVRYILSAVKAQLPIQKELQRMVA